MTGCVFANVAGRRVALLGGSSGAVENRGALQTAARGRKVIRAPYDGCCVLANRGVPSFSRRAAGRTARVGGAGGPPSAGPARPGGLRGGGRSGLGGFGGPGPPAPVPIRSRGGGGGVPGTWLAVGQRLAFPLSRSACGVTVSLHAPTRSCLARKGCPCRVRAVCSRRRSGTMSWSSCLRQVPPRKTRGRSRSPHCGWVK